MKVPFRYKLAVVGFLTTFAALLTRNALTIAIVDMVNSSPGQSNQSVCPSYDTKVLLSNSSNMTGFSWPNRQKGLLLGGFFLGNGAGVFVVGVTLQRLDVRKSVTMVLMLSGIISLVFPYSTAISYKLALGLRFLLGIIQEKATKYVLLVTKNAFDIAFPSCSNSCFLHDVGPMGS